MIKMINKMKNRNPRTLTMREYQGSIRSFKIKMKKYRETKIRLLDLRSGIVIL